MGTMHRFRTSVRSQQKWTRMSCREMLACAKVAVRHYHRSRQSISSFACAPCIQAAMHPCRHAGRQATSSGLFPEPMSCECLQFLRALWSRLPRHDWKKGWRWSVAVAKALLASVHFPALWSIEERDHWRNCWSINQSTNEATNCGWMHEWMNE